MYCTEKKSDLRTILQYRLQTGLIIVQIFLKLARFNVEHIDENFYIAEYVVSLRCEVVLHESFLATAIPEVEN